MHDKITIQYGMPAEPYRGERMRTDMMTFGVWIALFFIVQAVLTAVQYFTAGKL